MPNVPYPLEVNGKLVTGNSSSTPITQPQAPPSSSSSSSSSPWRTVRERILANIRGTNAVTSNPPRNAHTIGGTNRTMLSALLALVELKRAHWAKGVYFIFSVSSNPRSNADCAKDTILACNLSRHIPYISAEDSTSVSAKILSDFESVGFSGNNVSGTWESADGRIKCRLYNGGPVNWSKSHHGLLTTIPEALLVDDLKEMIVTVLNNSKESDENGVTTPISMVPTSKTSPSSTPLAVFGTFSAIIDLANLIVASMTDDNVNFCLEMKSFAGYAKWSRVQLLNEFCRDSWGAVLNGPQTMVTSMKDQPAVDAVYEKLLEESSQFKE